VGRTIRTPVSRNRRKRQGGNSLVELTFCFMGFVLLTLGTFDFAMAVYASNFCTYAARQASRWAIVHGNNSATSTNCSANPGIAGGCAANSSDVSNYVSGQAMGSIPAN